MLSHPSLSTSSKDYKVEISWGKASMESSLFTTEFSCDRSNIWGGFQETTNLNSTSRGPSLHIRILQFSVMATNQENINDLLHNFRFWKKGNKAYEVCLQYDFMDPLGLKDKLSTYFWR